MLVVSFALPAQALAGQPIEQIVDRHHRIEIVQVVTDDVCGDVAGSQGLRSGTFTNVETGHTFITWTEDGFHVTDVETGTYSYDFDDPSIPDVSGYHYVSPFTAVFTRNDNLIVMEDQHEFLPGSPDGIRIWVPVPPDRARRHAHRRTRVLQGHRMSVNRLARGQINWASRSRSGVITGRDLTRPRTWLEIVGWSPSDRRPPSRSRGIGGPERGIELGLHNAVAVAIDHEEAASRREGNPGRVDRAGSDLRQRQNAQRTHRRHPGYRCGSWCPVPAGDRRCRPSPSFTSPRYNPSFGRPS